MERPFYSVLFSMRFVVAVVVVVILCGSPFHVYSWKGWTWDGQGTDMGTDTGGVDTRWLWTVPGMAWFAYL